MATANWRVGNHTHHTSSKPHTTPDAHHNHLSPWSRLNSPGKATTLKCWHPSNAGCAFSKLKFPSGELDISECQGIHMWGHLIVVFSSGGIKCPRQKGSLHLTGRNAACRHQRRALLSRLQAGDPRGREGGGGVSEAGGGSCACC